MILRKNLDEIERIARAGALVAETISHVGEHLKSGITMLELDHVAERFIRAHGGVPTSLGYKGYPARSASRRTTSSFTASPTRRSWGTVTS